MRSTAIARYSDYVCTQQQKDFNFVLSELQKSRRMSFCFIRNDKHIPLYYKHDNDINSGASTQDWLLKREEKNVFHMQLLWLNFWAVVNK